MDTPKPRALTYTEMMNGGKQQVDPEVYRQELDFVRRTETLEEAVEHLEQSLHQPDVQKFRGSAHNGKVQPGNMLREWQ